MVEVDSHSVTMEIDTGAAVSCTYVRGYIQRVVGRYNYGSVNSATVFLLRGTIPVVEKSEVTISYKKQVSKVPLVVVNSEGPCLFCRNCLDWQEMYCLRPKSLHSVLQHHKAMFQEGLGTLQGEGEATTHFCKSKSVPYALRDKVDAELDHLVEEGTF